MEMRTIVWVGKILDSAIQNNHLSDQTAAQTTQPFIVRLQWSAAQLCHDFLSERETVNGACNSNKEAHGEASTTKPNLSGQGCVSVRTSRLCDIVTLCNWLWAFTSFVIKSYFYFIYKAHKADAGGSHNKMPHTHTHIKQQTITFSTFCSSLR